MNKSWVLKACVFATGLSGIVSEYVMSTLASYILGDAILQWTLTLSVMLFAMGVGSRVSKYIEKNLLELFIATEFLLSIFCAASAMTSYFLSIYIESIWFIIYSFSFSIGFFIGLEIPVATRLNDKYEELRTNISAIMEKDYFGALIGGIFFAFYALPYLGLTYTPIVLGSINFFIALLLVIQFFQKLVHRRLVIAASIVTQLLLVTLFFVAKPIILYGEQNKYLDRIVYEEQTVYQKIVMTRWKDYHWLYLNGSEQFSSFDEEKYHEPLIHPAMLLSVQRKKILIMGGGDGLGAREVLKYKDVESITIVDIDPSMTKLGKQHPVLLNLNENSMNDSKVKVINEDALAFLKRNEEIYDVIIVDLPDPKTVTLSRLYSRQAYQLMKRHLARGGVMVTQATSPFFSNHAFMCILKTIESAGFAPVPYHNHVPTMGEWGFVLAMNSENINREKLKHNFRQLSFSSVMTRFLNNEVMAGMLSFGKDQFKEYDVIEINDEFELKLTDYYKRGYWNLY